MVCEIEDCAKTIVDPQGITTTLTYDAADRVRQITQTAPGDAPSVPSLQRTTVLTYDALGNITSVTDPLGHTVSYRYDIAGRLTHQTLPDSRVITFTSDFAQGRATLAPPGRPEHVFTDSPLDLLAEYLPPQIGLGEQRSQAHYDLLQQLTQLTRPDGSQLGFGYDPIGRTTAITTTQGVLRATYDPTNGELATLTASDGSTLTYAYDADGRPTSLSWAGTISGIVQQTYTRQGQVATQRVNAAPAITFAYDAAGALTQAGDLRLHLDPARGRLTGSALGSISDSWQYSGLGEPGAYQASISGTAALALHYQRDAPRADRHHD